MVPCCGRPWWTTAYQTCMRCLMQALEATRCRAVGNTACTQVRDPATDTVNPNHCTIHPAWSRLGPPANITRARIQLVLLCLRASFAAWRSLSVISTISLSITLRSNLTFHTCSGCRVLTRKVWRLDCDFFHLFGLGGWLWKGWVACIPLNWLTSFMKCLLHLFERLSLWNVCEEHLCFSVLFFVCQIYLFFVISDDSSLINESMMSGTLELNLISVNPRLKASCGGRSVSRACCFWCSECLRRLGPPYWLMVRQQKADSTWMMAFLTNPKKKDIDQLADLRSCSLPEVRAPK